MGRPSLGCTMTKPGPWKANCMASPEPPRSSDFMFMVDTTFGLRFADQATAAIVKKAVRAFSATPQPEGAESGWTLNEMLMDQTSKPPDEELFDADAQVSVEVLG